MILLSLSGVSYGTYVGVVDYLAKANKVVWRTEKVAQGTIKAMVNSTGTVKPKLQVAIGCFVSGPVIELKAEFNQEVKKGDLLARIDPKLYIANVSRGGGCPGSAVLRGNPRHVPVALRHGGEGRIQRQRFPA